MMDLNFNDFMKIAICLILAMPIFGLLIAWFIHPSKYQNSRIYVFISATASAAVLLMGFSLFLNAVNFNQQQEITKATFTKKAIDSLWLTPNKLLTDSPHARPEFLASFYCNNLELYQSTQSLKTKETVSSLLEEQNIAIVLIQAWEDYLTFVKLDQGEDETWLTCFIQWAQSPYLKKHLDVLKYNYDSTTIALGNLLFEYASRLPVPTTDPLLYKNMSKQMAKDSRFLKILEAKCQN